ncbi:MAG: epimerase, partial [Flavobacteriales bacterium]
MNLAGKSVQCRPSQKNIQALIHSRVNTTRALGDAIARCSEPPSCWINASGAGIYPEDGVGQVEHSLTSGGTIMAEVARLWEAAFSHCPTPKTRKIALRITLVLGASGGVFPVFKQLVQLRQGGRQGSGEQRMSWIHIHDLHRMVLHIFTHDDIHGPVNAGSPKTYSNAEFMRAMRNAMGVTFGLPAPAWLLRMGAAILGINSELILASMDVYPKKMLDHGFEFSYPQLQ